MCCSVLQCIAVCCSVLQFVSSPHIVHREASVYTPSFNWHISSFYNSVFFPPFFLSLILSFFLVFSCTSSPTVPQTRDWPTSSFYDSVCFFFLSFFESFFLSHFTSSSTLPQTRLPKMKGALLHQPVCVHECVCVCVHVCMCVCS